MKTSAQLFLSVGCWSRLKEKHESITNSEKVDPHRGGVRRCVTYVNYKQERDRNASVEHGGLFIPSAIQSSELIRRIEVMKSKSSSLKRSSSGGNRISRNSSSESSSSFNCSFSEHHLRLRERGLIRVSARGNSAEIAKSHFEIPRARFLISPHAVRTFETRSKWLHLRGSGILHPIPPFVVRAFIP